MYPTDTHDQALYMQPLLTTTVVKHEYVELNPTSWHGKRRGCLPYFTAAGKCAACYETLLFQFEADHLRRAYGGCYVYA